jgi:hypothetical protein
MNKPTASTKPLHQLQPSRLMPTITLKSSCRELAKNTCVSAGAVGAELGLDGLGHQATTQNGVASAVMSAMGGTDVPYQDDFGASKSAPRTLKLTYAASVEADTPLTMIVASFDVGKAFDGAR